MNGCDLSNNGVDDNWDDNHYGDDYNTADIYF